MIYYDVTKSRSATHRSGLTRVSARLLASFPPEVVRAVVWRDGFISTDRGEATEFKKSDWLITPELFSEAERPGFGVFLRSRKCQTAAIFHDAIPIKYPAITWPQSVARHPEYLKMLSWFDRVWSVSQASQAELTDWWKWCGVEVTPCVDTIALGADFSGKGRSTITSTRGPLFLCVGIIEPRKNQSFLLDCCERLWAEGRQFQLHLVGRINPHFGVPIVDHVKRLKKKGRPVAYHEAATDETVEDLYSQARATLFPTIAEGCGLPLLESLWMGVPCVGSDIPPLRDNAADGGCTLVPVSDVNAWEKAIVCMLENEEMWSMKCGEASQRPLPTWQDAAQSILSRLG